LMRRCGSGGRNSFRSMSAWAMCARAVTLGKIADILFRRGELDEARALQEERLAVNQRLNDTDGIAATLWALSQVDLAEKKTGEAIPRIIEAYQIVMRLGRAEGIAVIGATLGQISAAYGQPDDARAVLSTVGRNVPQAWTQR